MNVLLLSYGIIGHDGRLNELIDMSNKLGNTTVIGCSLEKSSNLPHSFFVKKRELRYSVKSYLKFIFHCIKVARKMPRIDILIVDDFTASFAGIIINTLFSPKLLIQDSRELYIDKKMPGFGNVFLYFERKLYKKADLVICANSQRAQIMQEKYKLIEKPFVFENIRTLNGEYNVNVLNEKYKTELKKGVRIVSTGGCSIERGTEKLVMAMKQFPTYSLYIIGKGKEKDFNSITKIIEDNKLNNVYILDRVPLGELRYLIQQCDVGIVEYHKNDLNNLYCASGKIYEYMGEGKPLVTTENIPLVEICNKYNIGIADDCFINGIAEVTRNLKYYEGNVKKFMAGISVENNNQNLANKIRRMAENEV